MIHALRIRAAALASIAIAAAGCAAQGPLGEASDPKVGWAARSVRSTLVNNPPVYGKIEPRSITALDDGGAIITGQVVPSKNGWAARIDASGAVLWRFTKSMPAEDVGIADLSGFSPEIYSAAVNSAGDTFLCGDVPRDFRSDRQTAYVAQLGPRGELKREMSPEPSQRPRYPVTGQPLRYHFTKCFARGDSVIGIAQAGFNLTATPPFTSELSQWVVSFDARGNIEWESLLPTKGTIQFSHPDLSTVAPTDRGWIISTTDGQNTDFTSVGSRGQFIARKRVPARYLLVQPSGQQGAVEALSTTKTQLTLIRLNAELGITVESDVPASRDLIIDGVHRIDAHTLIAAGSFYGGVPTYRPAVVLINDGLRSQATLSLARNSDFKVQASAVSSSPGGALHLVTALSFVPREAPQDIDRYGTLFEVFELRKN